MTSLEVQSLHTHALRSSSVYHKQHHTCHDTLLAHSFQRILLTTASSCNRSC
jgi:hypothetical protein